MPDNVSLGRIIKTIIKSRPKQVLTCSFWTRAPHHSGASTDRQADRKYCSGSPSDDESKRGRSVQHSAWSMRTRHKPYPTASPLNFESTLSEFLSLGWQRRRDVGFVLLSYDVSCCRSLKKWVEVLLRNADHIDEHLQPRFI